MGYNKRLADSRDYGYLKRRGSFDVDFSIENKEVLLMLDRLVYSKLVRAKDIRKVFRKVMSPVRKVVVTAARQAIPNDPRKSWQGVRVIIDKKGEAAVIGLLNPRKAGTPSSYNKPRGGKSGIIRHRKKSKRTKDVEGYQGKDRAWILRIVNQGTTGRFAGTRKPSNLKYEAYRGVITAKKFFRSAEPAMKQAERQLATELGKIIENVSKE